MINLGAPISPNNLPAPIIIFCYNRANHLQQTLEALKNNALAEESDLYIFSDAAKGLEDQENVNKVRQVIQNINGFKSININLSKKNKGLASSIIDGVSSVINIHKRVIVLEDDILVSNDFLSFMNNALDKYVGHEKIYSVSGYSFKLEDLQINEEVSLVKRASSWGWGTWKNKWDNVDWDVKEFESFIDNKERVEIFKDAGEDQLPMLVKQRRGIIDSWAVRWTFHHYLSNAYCLVPRFSKIENIGADGSGTNFKHKVSKYDTTLHVGSINLPQKPEVNPIVTSFIRNYYKPSIIRRIINYYRYRTW